MFMDEYLKYCTACGGNWGAMLLTGIKVLFPEEYTGVSEKYNSMGFGDGGFKAFEYVCEWLAQHGVFPDERKEIAIDDVNTLNVDQIHSVIMNSVPFEELEKGKGIFEFFKQGDKSIGISYEDIDDEKDVYIYNIFVDDEYTNIGGHGTKTMVVTMDILRELVDVWNGINVEGKSIQTMNLFKEE